MRSFFAISLALMTGCGDNLGDLGSVGDHGDFEAGVEDDGVVAKLIPEICAARTWPEVVPLDRNNDLDLAVVAMANGASAAVMYVPKRGGALSGFLVDGRGLLMGSPKGTEILPGTFTALSAGMVDRRLVVGVSDGDTTNVSIVRDDLRETRKLALATGGLLGDTTIMPSRDMRVTATGGPNGLVLTEFDTAWSPMGSEVFARGVPTSMTSATFGNDAMVAWSTESSCSLQRVASGIESTQGFPCQNGRLATNFEDLAGQLVWEGDDNIMLSNVRASAHNEIANQQLLAPKGVAPRIAFDGAHYWVSYIDERGDVIVGYLDETDNLISTAIEGVRPLNDAYEIAIVNGNVWVYAYDGETGFGATRLCLVREGA